VATLAWMAASEVTRQIEKHLPGRDAKKLGTAIDRVAGEVGSQEQILSAASGTWFDARRCLIVATSRQVIVADDQRLDAMPYEKLLSSDFSESWRKARLILRAQGSGADVKDIHLDRARELRRLIDIASRSRTESGTYTQPQF
jgi:hypothetical protein